MKSIFARLCAQQPQLFSTAAITIDATALQAMAEVIAAIESVVALPSWQSRVLAWAPAIARQPVAARGVFLGYDFHLTADGPKLIEINTNAGGGLINAYLRAAHGHAEEGARIKDAFVGMFREEWRLERGAAPLRRIAIVDENPGTQFLAPEFALFKEVFEQHGIAAVIVDPGELVRDGNRLLHAGEPVNLIYNRLTDFALDATVNADLRAVFEAGGVVLTPHPPAHALYADKRNLMLLSDAAALTGLGVDAATPRCFWPAFPGLSRLTPKIGSFLGRAQALVLQAAGRLRRACGLSRRQADQAGIRGNPAWWLHRSGNRVAVGACRAGRRRRAAHEGRYPLLCLRPAHPVGCSASLPRPDDQFPDARRRFRAGIRRLNR